jgi:hypothetical protein
MRHCKLELDLQLIGKYLFLKIMNKAFILFISLAVITVSCRQINNHIKLKKYDGIWLVKSLQNTLYDTLGNENGTTFSDNLTGELILKRERDPETTYSTDNLELANMIQSSGDWNVYYRSKEDVLSFGSLRSTVLKRSKKEMILAFILGDGSGRRTSKHVFTFEFKENIEE